MNGDARDGDARDGAARAAAAPGDDPWGRSGTPGADDPRLQSGLEHLQRAAHEVIAASRALLDVAEDLVDDPRSAQWLAGLVGGVGDVANLAGRRRPGSRSRASHDGHGGEDDDGDPPVQRIPVS